MPVRSDAGTTPTAPIRIREVVDPEDVALREAHKLLVRSFAKEERVTFSEWRSTIAEKAAGLLTDINWHLVVAEADGRLVGLASGTYLGNVNIGIIGYLAMSPDIRSKGIGTRLRMHLRRRFERDAMRVAEEPLEAIIGEVSVSNPWLRRLAKRRNVLLLDFRYYQPSLYEGDKPSPFVLYYESLRRERSHIPVSELRRILYTMWRRSYRVSRPLDDPAFRAMIRSLDGRRSVGRLSLPSTRSR